MAEALFQLPHFTRAQNAGERRILTQSPGFFCVRRQKIANTRQGTFQDLFPFAVTAQERGGIGIEDFPAGEVLMGHIEQGGPLAQARGHAAAQLQTDLVPQCMTHDANLAGTDARVNAAVGGLDL